MTFKKNDLSEAINRVIKPNNVSEITSPNIKEAKENILQKALQKLVDDSDKKDNKY